MLCLAVFFSMQIQCIILLNCTLVSLRDELDQYYLYIMGHPKVCCSCWLLGSPLGIAY